MTLTPDASKRAEISEQSHAQNRQLHKWLTTDPQRLSALKHVASLSLPQGMIAAGFVRNLVWDRLHSSQYQLNDVDVIYFDSNDTRRCTEQAYFARLVELEPNLPWSVKNQARMHLRNGDKPYQSAIDAMCYWPEKETAVAARWINNQIEVIAPFGIQRLFELHLTPNPARDNALFHERLTSKSWLSRYPKLQIKSR
ncbi:nucleotidyltransferase family protein [Shewanella waksmanii]|uniref:nucleotidyltransferase family protein n=1 Tax=Shewanella waksmanii TaxID=213783 RepID=UPI0037358A2E